MVIERKETLAMRLASRTSPPDGLRAMFDNSLPKVATQVANTFGIPMARALELVDYTLPSDIKEKWVNRVLERHAESLCEHMTEEELFATVQFFDSEVGKSYLRSGGYMTEHMVTIANQITDEVVDYVKQKLDSANMGQGG